MTTGSLPKTSIKVTINIPYNFASFPIKKRKELIFDKLQKKYSRLILVKDIKKAPKIKNNMTGDEQLDYADKIRGEINLNK